MDFFNVRAFNPQPEPPADLRRFGFDPQPEPPRPVAGLLLPAVQV